MRRARLPPALLLALALVCLMQVRAAPDAAPSSTFATSHVNDHVAGYVTLLGRSLSWNVSRRVAFRRRCRVISVCQN